MLLLLSLLLIVPTYVSVTDASGARAVSIGAAGVNGTNAMSIQGITGGVAVPVSGTVTASNPSVGTTGAGVPGSATYIGANKNGNLVAPLLDSNSFFEVAIENALPAGTNVIGHVITDSGSVSSVTIATDSVGLAKDSKFTDDAAATAAASESATTRLSVFSALRVLDTAQGAGSQLVTAKGDQTNGLWVNVKNSPTVTANAGTGNFTVVQSTGTNLHIVCDSGCGGAASFSDQGAFTAGTTAINIAGGVFNDGLANVTSGDAAAPRITAHRGLHVNLRDNSGNEIGISGAPVRVDPTGTTTQPVSGTITADQGGAPWTVVGTIANDATAVGNGAETQPGVGRAAPTALAAAGHSEKVQQDTTNGAVFVELVGQGGTVQVGAISATNALKTDVSSIAGTATVTAANGVQRVGIAGNANATLDAALGAVAPANAVLIGTKDGAGNINALMGDQSFASTTLSTTCSTTTACAATASEQIEVSGLQSAELTITATGGTLGPTYAMAADASYDGGTTYLNAKCVFVGAISVTGETPITWTATLNTSNITAGPPSSWILSCPGAPSHVRARVTSLGGTSPTITASLRAVYSQPLPLPVGSAQANGMPLASNSSQIGIALMAADSSVSTTGRLLLADASGLKVSGAGTAGSAAGGVVSVQGVAGGTNLNVNLAASAATVTVAQSGSPWGVIGTIANDSTAIGNGAQVLPGVARAGSTAVMAGRAEALEVDTVSGGTIITAAATSNNTATSQKVFTANTALNVKAGAGNVYGWSAINASASVCWLQFYNTAGAPTCGTGVVWAVPLPVTPGVSNSGPNDIPVGNFSTGIGICVSTTSTGSTTCGSTASGTIFFK